MQPFLTDAATYTNKRSATRVPYARKGVLLVVQQGYKLPIKTFDISLSGLGLISPDNIPIGTRCAVNILSFDPHAPDGLIFEGTIAHSILSGTQGYRIGIQFSHIESSTKSAIERIVKTANWM